MALDATTIAAAERPIGTRASRKPLRIALFGGFGIGNFGNDASLEAALAFLRAEQPEAELSSICSRPDVVGPKFGLPVLPTIIRPKGFMRWADLALLRLPRLVANWAYTLSVMDRFDVILFPGTGVFDDFRDTPFGWPSRLLRWCLAARLRGVRLAFLSVGAGPILNPVSRALMKRAAQLAQHRSYRDDNSLKFMQGIGVDDRESRVLPDVAFLLPAPACAAPREGEKLTVGVGVMNYSGWRASKAVHTDYVEKHARFIEWLEERGYGVKILVGQTTDWIAVREIEARLGRPLASAEGAHLDSFDNVMRAIAETDIVVASRYHVQIAALKMGRPLISLSYAPKSDALLAEAGLEGFTQDIHDIDLDRLARQLETLAGERDHYAALVRERVRAMEERLRTVLAELDLLDDAVTTPA